MSERLTVIVDDHLRGCLPPGVPPSYRTIVATKKGRNEAGAPTITADVIMFDGQAAKVVLTQHRPLRSAPAHMRFSIWSHRFIVSSAVYWEDGAWHREPETPLDLFGLDYCERGRAALSREERR